MLKKPLGFECPLRTTAKDVTVKLEKLIKLIATAVSSTAGKLPEGVGIVSHTIKASTQRYYKFSLKSSESSILSST